MIDTVMPSELHETPLLVMKITLFKNTVNCHVNIEYYKSEENSTKVWIYKMTYRQMCQALKGFAAQAQRIQFTFEAVITVYFCTGLFCMACLRNLENAIRKYFHEEVSSASKWHYARGYKKLSCDVAQLLYLCIFYHNFMPRQSQ